MEHTKDDTKTFRQESENALWHYTSKKSIKNTDETDIQHLRKVSTAR